MKAVDTLRQNLAKKSKVMKDKIDREAAARRGAPGVPSSEAIELATKALTDMLPENLALVKLQNRDRFDEEYAGYPDTQYYRSKSFWEMGGSYEDIVHAPTTDPGLRDLQALADEAVMLANMMQNTKQYADWPYEKCVKSLKTYQRLKVALRPFEESHKKALATGNVGAGAEWVPTEFTADLIDEVRLATLVSGLFRVIPMSAPTYTVPVSTARPRAYIASQASSDSPTSARSSNLGTGNISLTPVTFAVRVNLSYEWQEDSIVPALPLVREKIVAGLVDGVEDAVINGDTTSGAHQDTGLQSTFDSTPDDVRVASWSGLRKLVNSAAKVDFDTGTEAFTTANFRAIRKTMGVYGQRPEDLAWIVSMNAYIRMLSLAEVITMDKIGALATILTGQLGAYDMIPIIVSEYVRTDLNTSGVYDAATITQTIALCVHRPSFLFGERRGITVEMETRPSDQQHIMIATLRRDWKKARATGDNPVGLGYDFAA